MHIFCTIISLINIKLTIYISAGYHLQKIFDGYLLSVFFLYVTHAQKISVAQSEFDHEPSVRQKTSRRANYFVK